MVYCCVPLCRNKRGKVKNVSFHEFPCDGELREKWVRIVSRLGDSGGLWQPNDRSVVCSDHFTKEDFRDGCKKKILKMGSSPSIIPHYLKFVQGNFDPLNRSNIKKSLKKRKLPLVPKQVHENINVSSETAGPKLENEEAMLLDHNWSGFKIKKEAETEECKLESEIDVQLDMEQTIVFDNKDNVKCEIESAMSLYKPEFGLESEEKVAVGKEIEDTIYTGCRYCVFEKERKGSVPVHHLYEDKQECIPSCMCFKGSMSDMRLQCKESLSLDGSFQSPLLNAVGQSTVLEDSRKTSIPKRKLLNLEPHLHNGEEPHFCKECGRCFSQKSYLQRHQQMCSGNCPYKCAECGKSFPKKSVLKIHLRVHSGVCAYKCAECGKSFSQKSNLQTHQRIHTRNRTFQCAECGKSFSKKSVLQIHLRVHNGVHPYKCVECGRSFPQKPVLQRHLRVHAENRPFKCVTCGQRFSQKTNLQNHEHLHTGDHPFKCVKCGNTFSYKSSLKMYQRVHTGDYTFKCAECGKSFSRKINLQKHQCMHTGDHSFKCAKRGKSFSQKINLQNRQRMHTGGLRCIFCA